jgi:ketosteroid isomerase-like protein
MTLRADARLSLTEVDLTSSSADIATFLAGFLEDFNNLDWPRFRARFSDASTVFFPQHYRAGRAMGRDETDAAWGAVFAAIRTASGKSAAPYMRLEPQELIVQEFGDTAIVTFTLRGGPGAAIGRRSLVLAKDGDGWKIAHLHGSTATAEAAR